jgi:polyphosphate kinase 2 (PPK2 family)
MAKNDEAKKSAKTAQPDDDRYKTIDFHGQTCQVMTGSYYDKELRRLQIELVKLQEWVKYKGLRVVVLFEGRDAAGKGGVIKRITEALNPRICRVEALAAPTEKEKTMLPACHRPAKLFSLTAAGTIGPASNGLWISAPKKNIRNSCGPARNSRRC